MISEIPLTEFGLMTVEAACSRRGWVVRTVQKWITEGLLPVACAGKGKRGVYLLRQKDVDAFTPPTRGRPKKAAPKKPRGKK